MASVAWSDDDREFLESLADRRDWIGDALKRFPDRSEPAVRCMMQKIRASYGMGGNSRFFENAWMADAVNGSQRLLEALMKTGQRP